MRALLRLSSLVVLLSTGACAEPHNVIGPSPTPTPNPDPAPAPVAPVFHLVGRNDHTCNPLSTFDPHWRLVVVDAGDSGMDVRAMVRPEATADCRAPFTGDAVELRGRRVFGPRTAGEASFVLEHLPCGRAEFSLWDRDTLLARTAVTTGRDCY